MKLYSQFTSHQHTNCGTTIVEVIVALAIAATALVGMTTLFTSGFEAYSFSRGYTDGVYLAQEKMEQVSERTMDSETIQGITYTWERKSFPIEGKNSANFVQVEVLVKWSDSHGNHSINLVSLQPASAEAK